MLSDAARDQYWEQGFLVVRDLFSPAEVAALGERVDAIVAGRIAIPQGDIVGGRATGISRRRSGAVSRADPASQPGEEVRLTAHHARRGSQVYPTRSRPIDEAARQAGLASAGPYADLGSVSHLCDHDPFFVEVARHPNLVAVVRDFLGPNVKLFFDHLFYKGPYGGANRYHQDGFFEFSDRSLTCWIALDEVTTDNGCLRYIPDTAAYGQFRFDEVAEGITARELDQEVLAPLRPGDAVIHDRWTVHATGPNETPRGRRGWALHFTSAKSRFIHDPTFTATTYTQTADGRHLRDEEIDGNRFYRLVCGREFPGCV